MNDNSERACRELTLDTIKRELERSEYNTRGIKVILPIFFGIFLLMWIVLTWKQGVLAFVSTGICFGLLFFLVIYMAIVSVGVSDSINKLDFFIEKVAVVGKKFRPGNAEDAPEFHFIFEKYGKYRLAGKGDPDSVQIGDEYYVLLCGKSRKVRFIYNAERWQISEIDFIEKNGIYKPAKVVNKE